MTLSHTYFEPKLVFRLVVVVLVHYFFKIVYDIIIFWFPRHLNCTQRFINRALLSRLWQLGLPLQQLQR